MNINKTGQKISQSRPGIRFKFVSKAKDPININIAAQIGDLLLSEALPSSISAKFITNDRLRYQLKIFLGKLRKPFIALRKSYRMLFIDQQN
ncbi:Uncharacterised protein [uncultured archaeon]|nr:Uncharacterised protein [uncultured archaeon]